MGSLNCLNQFLEHFKITHKIYRIWTNKRLVDSVSCNITSKFTHDYLTL